MLRTENLDFGRGVFVLEDTKTNDTRLVPIPPNLKDKLNHYLAEQHLGPKEYLFASTRGGNKDGNTPVFDNVDWHYNFHARLRRLGIRRPHLTPYSLRHSFITRLLEEDVNLFKVQKIVGHRRLSTTAQYTHMTTKDLIRAINKDPLIMKYTDPNNTLDTIEEVISSLRSDSRFHLKTERGPGRLTFEIEVCRDH